MTKAKAKARQTKQVPAAKPKAKLPARPQVPFVDLVKRAEGKKLVLHIGCGSPNKNKLHQSFRGEDWHELRLDIDPNAMPDICTDMIKMDVIPDNAVDAVWSSHNIEHLYPHMVEVAFKEIFRVIKPMGHFLVTLPDIQSVASYVANGVLEEPIYDSPAGPICPIDILYGFRPSMARGNLFMAHKTGFTAQSLGTHMRDSGFTNIRIQRQWLDLWALGHKMPLNHPQRVEKVTVEVDDRAKGIKVPAALPLNRSPHPGNLGPNRLTDELDIPPKIWKPLGLKKSK